MAGRPEHEPTPETRQAVQLHTTVGTTQSDIARVLGIDEKTLRKHYRDELDLARSKANATIGGALFNKAKGGDTAAMIFWMKTQAGWRETTKIEGPGPNGEHTINSTSPAALLEAKLDAIARRTNGDTTEG